MVTSPSEAVARLRQLLDEDVAGAESSDDEVEALAAIVALDTASAIQRIAAVLLRPQGIVEMPLQGERP